MIQGLRRLGADRHVAAANLVLAAVIAVFCVGASPERSLGVQIPSAIVVGFLFASTVGLALRTAWADKVTRAAALVLLITGMLAVASLTMGIAFHRAIGGPGTGPGPFVLSMGLLLVIPYAVVYPMGLLSWVASRKARN
jgi:hypothetical protein